LAPSSRLDQCVTPSRLGGGVSVATTIRSRSIVRGRPDRGASSRPASPRRSYRPRQVITVCRLTPRRSAISVWLTPFGSEQHDPRPLRQPRLNLLLRRSHLFRPVRPRSGD